MVLYKIFIFLWFLTKSLFSLWVLYKIFIFLVVSLQNLYFSFWFLYKIFVFIEVSLQNIYFPCRFSQHPYFPCGFSTKFLFSLWFLYRIFIFLVVSHKIFIFLVVSLQNLYFPCGFSTESLFSLWFLYKIFIFFIRIFLKSRKNILCGFNQCIFLHHGASLLTSTGDCVNTGWAKVRQSRLKSTKLLNKLKHPKENTMIWFLSDEIDVFQDQMYNRQKNRWIAVIPKDSLKW